jgi:hypothetical protein
MRSEVCLSVYVSLINNFSAVSSQVMPFKGPSRRDRSILRYVRTSEVDAKLAPVRVEQWRVKFGNHGYQTILMWLLKPFLCNSGSHTCTYCVSTVTMETKARNWTMQLILYC